MTSVRKRCYVVLEHLKSLSTRTSERNTWSTGGPVRECPRGMRETDLQGTSLVLVRREISTYKYDVVVEASMIIVDVISFCTPFRERTIDKQNLKGPSPVPMRLMKSAHPFLKLSTGIHQQGDFRSTRITIPPLSIFVRRLLCFFAFLSEVALLHDSIRYG